MLEQFPSSQLVRADRWVTRPGTVIRVWAHGADEAHLRAGLLAARRDAGDPGSSV